MSNSIQDFIGQLKNIDVANLLEKAKTVKIEDFRNIKFSDLSKIKDSKYFYPISGFLFASLFTIFTTIPTYKSMKSTIDKSKRYSSIVIITHQAKDILLKRTIKQLSKKKYLIQKPKLIRVENI